MSKTQIRQQIQTLDIADAQVSNTANIATIKLADGPNFLKRDGSVIWTAAQNGGGFKLTNILDPAAAQDAATKAYVDAVAAGLNPKQACRVATTANLAALSGLLTIDGVTVVGGDRVLVKDQTAAAANGIYIAASGAWTRATDCDTSAEYTSGTHTFIGEGTVNADSGWVVSTDGVITVGTTPVVWVQFSGTGQITAGAGMTKTGNVLDVIAADASLIVGTDNVKVQYDTTAANIELGANGIRIQRGTSGQILVANAAGDAKPVTMSGDATINNAGAISIGILGGNGLTRTGLSIDVNAADVSILVGTDNIKVQFDSTAANIELGTNGIRIKRGTSGQFWVANAAGDAAPVAMSGDATITNAGVLTLSASATVKPANYIVNEVPTGTLNGSNLIFTLANTPVVGKEQIFLNGLLQRPGASFDYVMSGATVTFNAGLAPGTTDSLIATYIK